jgi:2-hydroxychromene-2-carboxylate isomerase
MPRWPTGSPAAPTRRLQEICAGLGPGAIRVFCERWWSRLPLPLSAVDRAVGYWWEISMRQVEVSRTIVFDAPRHTRAFFEALLVDNLDVGRPEQLQIVSAAAFAPHPSRAIGPDCCGPATR